MSKENNTPFDTRCDILAEIWVNYKNDPQLEDFVTYNDLGLPIAYAISADIVTSSPKAEIFVNETFSLLLTAVGHEDDSGFDSLADVFNL